MDAKDLFLNGFNSVFEKIAEDDDEKEEKEEKTEKKPFPFGMKKEEKKEEKKEKKDDDDDEEKGEEKAASIFMDGFSDFFGKMAEEQSNPLDDFLKRIGKG